MSFEAIDIQEIFGNQSIKIPESHRIDDDKVYLKKVGNALYIILFHNPWQSLFESVDSFSQDFMNDRYQPERSINKAYSRSES
jgi:antitoxin VapB